jgi:hypothetical protein
MSIFNTSDYEAGAEDSVELEIKDTTECSTFASYLDIE